MLQCPCGFSPVNLFQLRDATGEGGSRASADEPARSTDDHKADGKKQNREKYFALIWHGFHHRWHARSHINHRRNRGPLKPCWWPKRIPEFKSPSKRFPNAGDSRLPGSSKPRNLGSNLGQIFTFSHWISRRPL